MRNSVLFLCLLLSFLWQGSAKAAALKIRVLDGGGRALEAAVVFLESPEAKAAMKPVREAFIAQVGKQFEPRVSVVTVGSAVTFPNRDTVRHHVYSFSKTKTFELKLYAGTPAAPVLFDRPGIAVLGCNIHDFMVAWVVVVETPYYGRADAEGWLTISHVPEGSYHLRIWHSSLPADAAPSDQPFKVSGAAQSAVLTLEEAGR
jgi:plastocyanin